MSNKLFVNPWNHNATILWTTVKKHKHFQILFFFTSWTLARDRWFTRKTGSKSLSFLYLLVFDCVYSVGSLHFQIKSKRGWFRTCGILKLNIFPRYSLYLRRWLLKTLSALGSRVVVARLQIWIHSWLCGLGFLLFLVVFNNRRLRSVNYEIDEDIFKAFAELVTRTFWTLQQRYEH